MKNSMLLALALVLVSVNFALATDIGPPAQGLDELVEREGGFDVTLVRPGADLGAYSTVYPWKVTLRVRGGVDEAVPATAGDHAESDSGFTRDDVELLKGFLSDALARELGRGESFQLVEEPGPTTLILRAAVVDVTSRKAPNSARQSGHGKRLLTAGTVYFDLIDPQSGVLLARVGERRKIKRVDQSDESYGTTGPWPEVGPWAEQAASDLLRALAGIGT